MADKIAVIMVLEKLLNDNLISEEEMNIVVQEYVKDASEVAA